MTILRTELVPGLTEEIVARCKTSGIKSVCDFVLKEPEVLSRITCTPYKIIAGIHHVLLTQYSVLPQCAFDLYKEVLATLAILPTGYKSLDKLLDGGIYTGEITEIVGPSASGKTQLCHKVACSVAIETEKKVLYVATNGALCPLKIEHILKSKNVNIEDNNKILQKIHCVEVHDIYDLFNILHEISSQLCSQNCGLSNLGLIIVDSIASVITPELGGHNAEGQGLLVSLSELMKSLYSQHALAIMVCNNIVSSENYKYKPALGNFWSHVPSVSLQLNFGKSLEPGINQSSEIHLEITLSKSCRQMTPTTIHVV